MRRLVACVIVAIAGLVIGGCTSQQAMTTAARGALKTDVSAVQRALDARHPRLAHAALVRLQTEIVQLEAKGEITTSAGNTVFGAAQQVQGNLGLITTTTTTTTTTTLPPRPKTSPPAPPGPKKKSHGHKHGD